MSKKWVAAAGAVFGALVEEGLEEVFPGLGELTYEGELAGTFTALGSAELVEERQDAIKSFVKYAYRQINEGEAKKELSQSDLDTFSENFSDIPAEEKRKIINNYRNIAPHEFHLIKDILETQSK
ncbi:hypothetical protein [Salinibacter ruber]|uniref:hypothetical protein n=1 Tax=Salinibacter ruber TaxID=146919 RepID=UPI000C9EE62B|nr:hypothetical protein [Salinibacter ruber]MCS3639202.1 hypothetical protein [Salinibacter ruber]